MELDCQTKNVKETKKIGFLLAKEILGQKKGKSAKVIALQGALGGGKTAFVQGFAVGLGIRAKILSPTFIIERAFPIKKSKYKHFHHFDCYRVRNSKEILRLGFKNILASSENIIVVEWAERVSKILPKNSIRIKFGHVDKSKREIKIIWPEIKKS